MPRAAAPDRRACASRPIASAKDFARAPRPALRDQASMKVYFTRDSVCAGDDGDAPHAREIELPDDLTLEGLVRAVVGVAELPSITGGQATWCIASMLPIAVVAQQWDEPRFVSSFLPKWNELDVDVTARTIKFHFTYFAQQDPTEVYEVLHRLRLRAG